MSSHSVLLEGAHVRLEPLEVRHAPELFDAAQDDAIWRYMPCPRPRAPLDVEAWISEALGEQAAGHQLAYAIVERVSGRAVGSTRYLDIRAPHRGLEIGWSWIGTRWQRSAVNSESKLLLLTQAFEGLGMLRVQLKTDARNLRSQAAIERLGARREGVLRQHIVCWDGHVRDTVLYSIVLDEWPGVRDALRARLARG